jgi:hypothetical protein
MITISFLILRVCSANPLATNFKLTDGQVQITVPNVPTRRDYIVVGEFLLFRHRLAVQPAFLEVFGDSGNASPQFTIDAAPAPVTSTTSTANTTPPVHPATLSADVSSPTESTSTPTIPSPQAIQTSITSTSTALVSPQAVTSTAGPSRQLSGGQSVRIHEIPMSVLGIISFTLWYIF